MLIRRSLLYSFSLVISTLASCPGIAADVLTYHNDNPRTGWNPNEIVLTPSNVNMASFGLKFTLAVDGKVDAQPLYASNSPVLVGDISWVTTIWSSSPRNMIASMLLTPTPVFSVGTFRWWAQERLHQMIGDVAK
jgi:hypothetical protein